MFLSGVCFYAVERVRTALLKYKIQRWGHVRNKSAVFNELGVFKLKKKYMTVVNYLLLKA